MAFVTWLSSFVHSVFAFIVILVPLVIFHEFGHFVFARLFGVKAEIFSVGMGPKIWSRKWGETDFRLSAVPIGGYVKLLGEDQDSQEAPLSEAELKRALHKQKPWKRFFIFFGGPLFNFILAVFIFMVILVVGEPQVSSHIGRVVQGSMAEKAGFQSGDDILKISGQAVQKFDEVAQILNENPNQKLIFTVRHPQSTESTEIEVETSSQPGLSSYGESTAVGDLSGLLAFPRGNQVGVSNPNSQAAVLGLQTGDQIIQVNQQKLKNWEELESMYRQLSPRQSLQLEVKSGRVSEAQTGLKAVELMKPENSQGLEVDFGLYSSELFVERPVAGSPAEAAGIQSGDRITAVAGQTVHSFFELKSAVQKGGETQGTVSLQWERMGKQYEVVIRPSVTQGRDPLLNQTTSYTVGVMPMLVFAEPVTYIERVFNPLTLVIRATERMVSFSWKNLVLLKKMVTGQVSVGNLGGPILMGKIAGESLSRGLIAFLTNMAIFSVGLGVLNILPIPALDGGHLLLLGVEAIRGKPLSLSQREIIQGVGIFMILALMGVAFKNDIARLFYL
ncbi:MAG: RIP metalloprotease RseP [Bdellovibrionia bacterium]